MDNSWRYVSNLKFKTFYKKIQIYLALPGVQKMVNFSWPSNLRPNFGQAGHKPVPSKVPPYTPWLKDQTRSRSYQTFIFPVFWFLLLSLRVCSIWKKCVYCTMAKLSSKKQNWRKKSLVGSTPGANPTKLSFFWFSDFCC